MSILCDFCSAVVFARGSKSGVVYCYKENKVCKECQTFLRLQDEYNEQVASYNKRLLANKK